MRATTKFIIASVLAAIGAVAIPVSTASADPLDEKATQKLWKAKCGSCHGVDGKGKTKQGEKMAIRDMTNPEWQKEFTDEKFKKALTEGLKREKDGKKQEMKAMKLKPEELDALIKYARGLK